MCWETDAMDSREADFPIWLLDVQYISAQLRVGYKAQFSALLYHSLLKSLPIHLLINHFINKHYEKTITKINPPAMRPHSGKQ